MWSLIIHHEASITQRISGKCLSGMSQAWSKEKSYSKVRKEGAGKNICWIQYCRYWTSSWPLWRLWESPLQGQAISLTWSQLWQTKGFPSGCAGATSALLEGKSFHRKENLGAQASLRIFQKEFPSQRSSKFVLFVNRRLVEEYAIPSHAKVLTKQKWTTFLDLQRVTKFWRRK